MSSQEVDDDLTQYLVRVTWRVGAQDAAGVGRVVQRLTSLAPPATPVRFSASSRGPWSATFPVRAVTRFGAAETAVELARTTSGLRPCDVEVLSSAD